MQVLFDRYGCLRKYSSAEQILTEFYSVRLEMYVKRKAYLIGMLTAESAKLTNQARFVLEKIQAKIKFGERWMCGEGVASWCRK